MDLLLEKYRSKLEYTSLGFVRSAIEFLDQEARMIGIKGPRGVGKTTLLLQYLKINFHFSEEALYASLDNIYFSENKLYHLVDDFHKRGGKFLFLDEVHKYPGWSQELKNIYDDFPEIKIVFTGSSLLEILNARADLSRRAIVLSLQGLSFREYIELELGIKLPAFSFDDIVNHHLEISHQVVKELKPLQYFPGYLKNGYYPFYKESKALYFNKLEEVVNMILEVELPLLKGVDLIYSTKLKQILWIVAESVPFVPNMTKLSQRIGINRKTLLMYIKYLGEAGIIRHVYKDAKGISRLQKPDKILLDNSNLSFMLSNITNIGTIRETFFVNQMAYNHVIEYAEKGDFIVNGSRTFEIGGKDKSPKQIKGLKEGFVAADDIEYGHAGKIPLWLFGFLY